ncbi:hypothetical protein VT98_12223, partial [Candidatus Electrothrix communis]
GVFGGVFALELFMKNRLDVQVCLYTKFNYNAENIPAQPTG